MPRIAPQMPLRLAQCAFEVFAERGFDAATIDEIAARAGVTKGSFYSHYRSKQDVIVAACEHYYRSYHRQIQAELQALDDPLARLRRVVQCSVHTCVIDRQTRVFTTEIFALALQNADVRAGWARFYDSVRSMYLDLVRAAQAAGPWETADPLAAVNLMLAAIEGVKLRAAFEAHIADPAEQEAIVAGLLEILGHPRSPSVLTTTT